VVTVGMWVTRSVIHHIRSLNDQDTCYVGAMRGVGRIYQQTFVDTYSRVAMAKLYTEKTPSLIH